jgi:hypothetical protein
MEGEGVHRPATDEGHYGPDSGATPRGRGSSQLTRTCSCRSEGPTTRRQRSQRCETAAVGGTSSKGVKGAAGKCCDRPEASRSSSEDGAASGGAVRKRGEPLSIPGCNKPGTLSAEKAVEVVRNHMDGTRLAGWRRQAEDSGNTVGSGREQSMSNEGRTHSNESHKRQRSAQRATAATTSRTTPGRSGDEAKVMRNSSELFSTTVRKRTQGRP